MWKLLYCLLLSCAFFPNLAHAEEFDNNSIIALSAAGIGDEVLLAKIDSLPCGYDVSTDQLIRLRSAGVANIVITAMVQRCIGSAKAQGVDDENADPMIKRTPGIYIRTTGEGGGILRVIRPTSVSGTQIEGNGSILFPFLAKLILPQPSAQTLAQSAQPTFYFYFESADLKTGDFGTSVSDAAQSPVEFSLVNFKIKSNQRVMTIGRATPFKVVSGIDPKNTLPFSVSEIGDGIFKVDMNAPLPAGQYAFVLRAGTDAYRIYDFKVQ